MSVTEITCSPAYISILYRIEYSIIKKNVKSEDMQGIGTARAKFMRHYREIMIKMVSSFLEKFTPSHLEEVRTVDTCPE